MVGGKRHIEEPGNKREGSSMIRTKADLKPLQGTDPSWPILSQYFSLAATVATV